MLQEYEKEAALQVNKIENAMNSLDLRDGFRWPEIGHDTTLAGAFVAHKYLFSTRFGVIEGDNLTMVFANMGPSNIDDACMLQESVQEADVEVISLAVWPLPQLGEPYTWALLIEDDDHEHWLGEAIRLHVNRPFNSDGKL